MSNRQYKLRQNGQLLSRTSCKLKSKKTIKVVAYGDSISSCDRKPDWFGGATSRENWWGNILEKMLNDHFPDQPFEIKSFGIGGQNAYEGLGRVYWLDEIKPDLVLLEFGTNDCGYTDIPPLATSNALTRIIDHIDVNLKSDIMIIGVVGDNPLTATNNHFEETAKAVHDVADAQLLPWIDLRAKVLLATSKGHIWEEYHNGIADCHPNDKGHAVWAKNVFENITNLINL